MCKAMEEMRNETAHRIAVEMAKKLIARGRMTLEEIAEDTELPLVKIRELAEQKTAYVDNSPSVKHNHGQ